jgi:GMP synthase-like glutamine amidotransferase
VARRALFIEHDPASPGGPVWLQFEKRGYEIVRFNVVSRENYKSPNVKVEFPDFHNFDVIVPMGSPWGVWEDERIGNWLLPELEYIKAAHNSGIPILGICFGGQLMARALGGSVAKGPRSELGWHMIVSDDKALIDSGPWFQYHWDRWTLPPKATEIARSPIASQAFVCGRTLALQFHPEVDREVLDQWFTLDDSCIEVTHEGLDHKLLLAQTSYEESEAMVRAAQLVDNFLDKVAKNEPVLI